ncbi:hypothetical protein MOXK23_23580 (plasmid) [Moraxella sp. K23]|jgi:hypothetical protein
MGRKLNISKTVIKFILDKRNDVNTYYTFEEIKKMLKNEFNIDMSLQAVRYQYEKNKNNQIFLNPIFGSSTAKEETTQNTTPKFDFKAIPTRQKQNVANNFDNEISDQDETPKKTVADIFAKLKEQKNKNPTAFDKKLGDDLTSEDMARLFGKAVD